MRLSKSNLREINYMLIPALLDIGQPQRRGVKPRASAPIKLASIHSVFRLVSDHFGITTQQLLSKGQYRTIAYPRQVAMYLIYKYCVRSFLEVGKQFKRHHTTVVHANKTIKDLMLGDPLIKFEVEQLELTVIKLVTK